MWIGKRRFPFPSPFYALPWLASLELLRRICLVAYQANGIKQPVGTANRDRGKGGKGESEVM